MEQCRAAGQWERMEALGKELLVTSPEESELLSAVGVAVFQQDRLEESRKYFEGAIVNEPDHDASHAGMGWYWVRKKKFASAEECLRRALVISPESDYHWIDLGRILLMQGNARGGKTCAEKALAIDSGNVDAIALHADAESAGEGIGRTPAAVRRERLEGALGLEPENANLHEALGEVLQEEGRLREAEERYREALALDPTRPWLWRKVRRMGLKRDGIDYLLSLPWRIGLWFIAEREFITIVIGLVFCAVWAAILGPISFLYRMMFRVELELLAARGTREVSISIGRRILRFVFLAIAAALYWAFIWWLLQQSQTWWFAGLGLKVILFGLIGFGIYLGIREVVAEPRHRSALQELDGGEEPTD